MSIQNTETVYGRTALHYIMEYRHNMDIVSIPILYTVIRTILKNMTYKTIYQKDKLSPTSPDKSGLFGSSIVNL